VEKTPSLQNATRAFIAETARSFNERNRQMMMMEQMISR
jgi:hypothetical protein